MARRRQARNGEEASENPWLDAAGRRETGGSESERKEERKGAEGKEQQQ